MPYIDSASRTRLRYGNKPRSAGELQYEIALLVSGYVNDNDLEYQTLNDVMGALDGASREFYRRIVAPYEDEKIAKNGDVYTCIPLNECDHVWSIEIKTSHITDELFKWCIKRCGHVHIVGRGDDK